jgi:hypothetical protein
MLRIRDPRSTLVDRHGPWCVVCLDYSSRREPLTTLPPSPQHTGVSQSLIPYLPTFPLCGEIPIHPRCLAEAPAIIALPQLMLDYVQVLGQRPIDEIDRAAKILHDHGLYSLSAALKHSLLECSATNTSPGDRSTLLERQLASLAGVYQPAQPFFQAPPMHASVGVVLHLSNAVANIGQLKEADQLLRHAEHLRGRLSRRTRDTSESHYRMRVAQIRRTPSAAREAIDAASDGYMTNTAYVLSGYVWTPTEPNRARRYFDSILAKGSQPSWLYRAESLLGLAAVLLRSERNRLSEAYRCLAAAQYILAVLHLQGTPHPGIHRRLTRSDLTPADILLHDPSFQAFSQQHSLVLRQEALSALQRDLFAELLLLFPLQQAAPGLTWPLASTKSTVLVLGQDTSEVQVLTHIQRILHIEGFRGILVKEEPDISHETNTQKVLRLAARCRFILVEHTIPAGQIDEVRLLAPHYVIGILHQQGRLATRMQVDLDLTYTYVKYFPYEPFTLAAAVCSACDWAESTLVGKREALNARYSRRGRS